MPDPHELPDAPQHTDHATTGSTFNGPVIAARDVNVAENQVINNAPPSADDVRYAWLIALVQHFGAAVPVDNAVYDDAPYISALQHLSLPDPQSLLRDTRQVLLKGMCGDPADQNENGWPDTGMPPKHIPPSTASLRVALLLLPFVDLYALDINGLWVSGLSALSSPAFGTMVSATWQRFRQNKTPETLQLLAFELAEKVSQPEYRVPIARLLLYLAQRWDVLREERQVMLRTRRYLPRSRPKEGAQLLRHFAVAAGASFGSVAASAAVGDLIVRGQEALLMQIWQRLTALDTAHAASVQPAAPAQPAPQVIRANSKDDIPVTPDEWRAELARRNTDFGRPNGYWCYVQPGTYRIGGWEKGDEWADITLDGFWIAKYPITVAQFAPFVREGYSEQARRFWTPNGWAWKNEAKRTQPHQWGRKNFDAPQQPVVGVTWYEATAYAHWIAAQLQRELPTGYDVRLPTEAEWETAAAFDSPGRQHRTYPWGEQPLTAQRAVYGGNWQDGPPSVGSRPGGAAACGALDLVGTVWESTTNDYDTYPQHSGVLQKDFTASHYKVAWRGGSYYIGSTFVRCGARIRYLPDDWFNFDGFRVVVAPQRVR